MVVNSLLNCRVMGGLDNYPDILWCGRAAAPGQPWPAASNTDNQKLKALHCWVQSTANIPPPRIRPPSQPRLLRYTVLAVRPLIYIGSHRLRNVSDSRFECPPVPACRDHYNIQVGSPPQSQLRPVLSTCQSVNTWPGCVGLVGQLAARDYSDQGNGLVDKCSICLTVHTS